MANITGVDNISLNQIMLQDLQEYLSANAIFLPTVWDLSDKVEAGAVSFDVPRISGGSTGDWPTAGAKATTGGVAIAVDQCLLDQFKQYSTYIEDADRAKTAANLDDYFYSVAPSKLGDLIEQFIYAELKKASASTPDNIFQLTGAGNLVPTVADLFTIAEKMDDLNIPKTDRYVAMGNAAYYALVQEDAIINGSKSLSNEALVNGAFSRVAGLTLLHGTNVTAGEVLGYHKEALAFAFANGNQVQAVESRNEDEFRDFRALKAIYGSKILDSGKRCVLGNSTGA
jgi:hypothetical protein